MTHISSFPYVKKGPLMKYLFPLLFFISISCEDNKTSTDVEVGEESLLFILSEGSYGNSDGSISVFKNGDKIQTIENVGANVQSLLVNEDKLFVAVTSSNKIIRYNITEAGLSLPGITIQTNNSGPRNMAIIGDELFFTNLYSKDIKIFNLITFAIVDSILLDGAPENIISDGNYIWVSVPYLNYPDQGNGTSVIKIDVNNRTIENTYNIGRGPYDLLLNDEILWISRTWYSEDYINSYHGSSSIDTQTGDISIVDYGAGVVCGGNIMKLDDEIYRAWNGGVVPLDLNLDLISGRQIGSYTNLYSAFSTSQSLYLGTTDYSAPDTVFIHDSDGILIQTLQVGVNPGDFTKWIIN